MDRLMKQISSFMNEIADEFKIVVVKAIRQVTKGGEREECCRSVMTPAAPQYVGVQTIVVWITEFRVRVGTG